MKTCKTCGDEKPIDDFEVSATMKSGRLNECKDCRYRKNKKNIKRTGDMNYLYGLFIGNINTQWKLWIH